LAPNLSTSAQRAIRFTKSSRSRDRHRLALEKRLFDEAQRMIAFAQSDGTVQTTTHAAAKFVAQKLIAI
jgi:hypothetical protein